MALKDEENEKVFLTPHNVWMSFSMAWSCSGQQYCIGVCRFEEVASEEGVPLIHSLRVSL